MMTILFEDIHDGNHSLFHQRVVMYDTKTILFEDIHAGEPK